MSTYTDSIDQHSIHERLEKLNNTIKDILEIQDLPSESVEIIARISMIKTNFVEALGKCEKNLISTAWLNDASSACENLNNYLNNFKSNKDTNTLKNNCNTHLDTLLKNTVNLNCVKSGQNLRGLNNAVQSYVSAMELHMNEYHKTVELYDAEMEKLRTQISSSESSSKEKLEELTNAIDKEKQRLDGFANTYQTQMNDDKETFTKMKASFEKEFLENQDKRKETNEEFLAVYKERFDTYEAQTKNLVGLISGNSFSFRYRQVADEAQKRASLWHKITMALLVVVAVCVVIMFWNITDQKLMLTSLVAKMFTTTTVAAGAVYAARQAAKQEEVEKYTRKTEMELMAFDPFIASLPEEQRNSLKEEFVKKTFGRDDVMGIKKSDKDNNEKKYEKVVEPLVIKAVETVMKDA